MKTMKHLTVTAAVAALLFGFSPVAAGTGDTGEEQTEARQEARAQEEQEERPRQERTEAAEARQRHTRPGAEASPRFALTLTGEVVSLADDAIQVRTTTGVETLRITPRTTLRAEPEKGEWIAVDFNRTDGELAIAEQVRPVTRFDLESAGIAFETVDDDEATERTRVRTDAGPGAWSGLTMTGTVVSMEDDALVLDTVTGAETVKIIDRTELVTEPREGDLVAVDITRDPEGVVLAHRVRPARTTAEDGGEGPDTERR